MEFKERFPESKTNFLEMLSIQKAVPQEWLKLLKLSGEAKETLFKQITNNPGKTKSKWLYWKLKNSEPELNVPIRYKWEKVLQREISDDEWNSLMVDTNKITISTKLRAFQYRLINYAIPTNIMFKKWQIVPNMNCSFCNIERQVETYVHLFCECPIVLQRIWYPLCKWLDYFCYAEVNVHDPYELLFIRFKGCFADMVNMILLITKHFIYIKRCLKEKLRFIELSTVITQYKNIEAVIAKKNLKTQKRDQKWLMYDKV